MTSLDELAALQRKAQKPAGHAAGTSEAWLVDHADKIFGPRTREELISMRSSGVIDSTTKVWTEGWPTWKPVESVIPSAPAAMPIDYATPVAKPTPPASIRKGGRIARYRRRVGHRSFIFQIWLAAWTASYLLWLVCIPLSGASHAPGPIPGAPFNPFMAPVPQPTPADLASIFTSAWICFLAGWGVVGLPVGIAAVATMENNKPEN
ncbi:MAG: DUF4339 domain-containing protein [Tepidisphaeraceae bacterium]|jgi:uncharacterized protein DUF4339